MPRRARVKGEECTYHVMARSISEVDLFKDSDDKEKYMQLLAKYCHMYKAKLYGYSLMDNHVHLFVYPNGGDISKIMHRLNTAYVAYFNRKHMRRGILFDGRFKSEIIKSDNYAMFVSAYIHHNAKDIMREVNGVKTFPYIDKEEEYPYSSYGIYVGAREDTYGIVDTEFVLGYFSKKPKIALKKYKEFLNWAKNKDNWVENSKYDLEYEIDESVFEGTEPNEYESLRVPIIREKTPLEILYKACELLDIKSTSVLNMKYKNATTKQRAFIVYSIQVLSEYTYKQICEFIGNMSLSGVARLADVGFNLVQKEKLYQRAFEEFVPRTFEAV